ncbi:hypothetical protein GGQ22_10470 [Nocardioides sp. zg-579]|uniref:histidine kinase n=1 Tax=Nocardioides marmotae TaxID=2663857 RepID=A0A6I3JBL2_9ACTN|nr:ATP-binding protein [Nocardioides marmotae]MCR6031867.1 hypothetical protein [Gordonia jinghuaiqii]MTB95508.1 hypothetical protein [Nocardioides marmotae]QKE00939.1 HAMP domain-containing histidine kinase [Nocardioides marmotae]
MRDVTEDLTTALAGATLDVERLPVVTGDPVQLRAVLQNLVANAATFVRPGEKAHVGVRCEQRDGRWRIEVVDRGIGVPAADASASSNRSPGSTNPSRGRASA